MNFPIRSLITAALCATSAAGASNPALEKQFNDTVHPYIAKYCVGCHSGKTPAGSLDLKTYATMDSVVADYPRWALLHDRLVAKEMPPKPMPAPPAADEKKVVDWIAAVRADELRRHAGDPGPVLLRRLSNNEYNYTVRDLTGVDIQPAKEFPSDPSNQAGFDNSGESLTMSAALMKKYLQAARDVSNKMVLVPDGIEFAPHPMLSETDRDKYPIQRIVNFYLSQPTDYADYFQAAWRYKYRAALGKPKATLASTAADAKVSAKYLAMVWPLIEEPAFKAKTEVGPMAKLQAMWNALPAPPVAETAAVHAKCVEMRDFVKKIRYDTAMQFSTPKVRGLPTAAQPLQNWKLKQFSLHHRESDPAALRNDTDPTPAVPTLPKKPGLHQDSAAYWAVEVMRSRLKDEDLVVPAVERSRYEASFSRLASVFPDVFFVSERGRFWPDESEDRGRLLSAGYHNVMGYFRDDTALRELILDTKGQNEINSLWEQFEYISNYTARTFIQFYLNNNGAVYGKGAESGSELPAGHEVTEAFIINSVRDVWVAKAMAQATADPATTNPGDVPARERFRGPNDPVAPQAMREHFDGINNTIRNLEKTRIAAEPRQIEALLKFAAKSFRRPLTKAEKDDLLANYRNLREKNSLSHEEALRESLVSILMSPKFLYRVDLLDGVTELRSNSTLQRVAVTTTGTVRHLSAYALASRLSYFLWSSMPDDELLRHAASGDLIRPDVLLAQARRMMKDDRVKAFATEFTGNWLSFRQFESFNSVDKERFPSFTNELREAMFQEPIRYVQDAVENNRSVLDLLYGKYTFVNPVLAKHYSMPEIQSADGSKVTNDTWVRIDDAPTYGRGGLLPMAVFLTNASPGLRTSPVKRGFWVVHKLLGESIPPPPAVVPELPHDESKMDLPLREILAQHRANPVCAGCHARFDTFGLAMEGYGPIGEARKVDLGGRPIDNSATFPGGEQGVGLEGVETFIRNHRQNNFVDGLSRSMVAYALNRSPQLSDEGLIDRMKANLAAKGEKFDTLIETILASPQFLNKRSPGQQDTPAPKPLSPTVARLEQPLEPKSKQGLQ